MVLTLALLVALSSVWDGVYTTEQAARGNQAYNASCAVCHRADLRGGQGRSLVGSRFWESWGEDGLSSLYSVVRERMPEGQPGSLKPETYLDIVAYILQRNEYPAGTVELTAESVKLVQVVGKNGPAPVPNFSLVRVVGCLEEVRPGAWRLTRSSEPARTRDPGPSKGDERERSLGLALGEQLFELMDAYDEPAGHSGQKVEVKGLLMRGAPNRVNFSSFQMLQPTCAS